MAARAAQWSQIRREALSSFARSEDAERWHLRRIYENRKKHALRNGQDGPVGSRCPGCYTTPCAWRWLVNPASTSLTRPLPARWCSQSVLAARTKGSSHRRLGRPRLLRPNAPRCLPATECRRGTRCPSGRSPSSSVAASLYHVQPHRISTSATASRKATSRSRRPRLPSTQPHQQPPTSPQLCPCLRRMRDLRSNLAPES